MAMVVDEAAPPPYESQSPVQLLEGLQQHNTGHGVLVSTLLGTHVPGFELGRALGWPAPPWDLTLSAHAEGRDDTTYEAPSVVSWQNARPHPNAYFCTQSFHWRIAAPWPAASPSVRSSRAASTLSHRFFIRHTNVLDPRLLVVNGLPPTPTSPTHPPPPPVEDPDIITNDYYDIHLDVSSSLALATSPPNALPAVIPPAVLTRLVEELKESTKPGALHSAFEYLFRIIHGAVIRGNSRSIPVNGVLFPKKLTWNDNTEALFSALWFRTSTTPEHGLTLSPPRVHQSSSNAPARRARLLRALLEIGVILEEIRKRDSSFASATKTVFPTCISIHSARNQIALALGGDHFAEDESLASAWRGNKAGLSTAAFRTLGCTPSDPIELVKFAYHNQLKYDPTRTSDYVDALADIAEAQSSAGLLRLVQDENSAGRWGRRDIDDALARFDITDTLHLAADETIIDNFFIKNTNLQPSERKVLAKHLRVLADVRNSDLLKASAQSIEGELELEVKKKVMTVEKAIKTLEIPSIDIDDDFLISIYISRSEDSQYTKDQVTEALNFIAEQKDSSKLKAFLSTGSVIHDTAPVIVVSSDQPVGLEDIGNTCYLNSLLQYFFIFAPLRKVVLDSTKYLQDNNESDKSSSSSSPPSSSSNANDDNNTTKAKVVGNRTVSIREIERSKKFVLRLGELFYGLIHSPVTSIYPERELAYLALVPSKEEIESPTSDDNVPLIEEPKSISPTTTTTTNKDTTNKDTNKEMASSSPVSSRGEPMDVDTVVKDEEGTVLGKRSTEEYKSENVPTRTRTLPPTFPQDNSVTVKQEERSRSFSQGDWNKTISDQQHVTLPREAGNAVQEALAVVNWKGNNSNNGNNAGATAVPPPLPPRPDQAKKKSNPMAFGKQNDAHECMDNMLFMVEMALDSEKIAKTSKGSGAVLQDVFYGEYRQTWKSLQPDMEDSSERKESVQTMTEAWPYQIVSVEKEEGKDIYDILDETFKDETIEQKTHKSLAITKLPVVYQVYMQRGQFDKVDMETYKSNAHVQFSDTISLDRYLDFDQNDLAKVERRNKSKPLVENIQKARKRLNELSGIEDMPGQLRALKEHLAQVQKDNNFTFNDGVKLEDGSTEDIVDALEREASDLEKEVVELKEKIRQLRVERETLWQDEKNSEYQLVAVFMHRGHTTFGHYYVYLRALPSEKKRWIKYNNEHITDVDEEEVFRDTRGSPENAYLLSYVRSDRLDVIDTVQRVVS